MYMIVKDGVCSLVSCEYFDLVKLCKNLIIVIGVLVIKVVLEDKVVKGVEYVVNGKIEIVVVFNEVILSVGFIGLLYIL